MWSGFFPEQPSFVLEELALQRGLKTSRAQLDRLLKDEKEYLDFGNKAPPSAPLSPPPSQDPGEAPEHANSLLSNAWQYARWLACCRCSAIAL